MAKNAQLLTELSQKNKGINYQRAKEAEKAVGGRQLPTGLEEEIAELVSAELEKNDDRLAFHIKGTVITPEDYKKLPVNFYFNFGEDRFNTADENAQTFCGNMQHLGYDAREFDDITSFVEHIETELGKKQGMQFLYNTGRKQSQSGYTKFFLAGLSEGGKTTGKKRPAQDKKDSIPWLEKGQAVEITGNYFQDGEVYTGTIVSCNEEDNEYEVKFDDDNSVDMVPAEHVLPAEAKQEESDEADDKPKPKFSHDDAVVCREDYFGDGKQYEGTVTGLNDDGTIHVEWEDGEETETKPSDLSFA